MDNMALIVIFLAFVAVTLVSNTLLIWFAYMGFANVTAKVTGTLRDLETSSETKEWLATLDKTAENAARISEITKQKVQEFDPVLSNIEARYGFMLAKVDTRVERLTADVSQTAERVRDAVARPAMQIEAFATGVQSAVEFLKPNGKSEG